MTHRQITNALTFDVEDYFQVSAFEKVVDRTQWNTFSSRVERNTDRILSILEEAGVKATFFVLGWIGERYPALVKRIHERGHEVACHGYSHRLVYEQTPVEFREETQRAKHLLEDIIGEEVPGYRAASYSIVRDSLWALDILAECGFRYDSSVFPIRHDRYGIPDAPRFPHQIRLRSGATLIEFPISTAVVGGVKIPVAGGGYFRLLPYAVTRFGLSRINKKDIQPFVFYLHPWELDPEQPRISVGGISRFRHYTNLKRCEARLSRLLRTYRFSAMRQILDGSLRTLDEVAYDRFSVKR
jgi:polysaccharide deacetylase family protein (PEP-CTERM system associated)